jgi:ribose transport system substrate-binding protein
LSTPRAKSCSPSPISRWRRADATSFTDADFFVVASVTPKAFSRLAIPAEGSDRSASERPRYLIEAASGGRHGLSQEDQMKTLVVAAGIVAGLALGAPAVAQTKPTVPIIVKDTTSPYWQAVLAGARKAGQDLGINVVELGVQSESDANGQIGMLEKAIASSPAAIVIAPAQSAALGAAIDEAAKKVKIIGIESAADTKAMTSLLATDNVKAGRIAADALASAITKTYGDTEGNVVIITAVPGVGSLDQRAKGFKDLVAAKYGAMNVAAEKAADGKPATGIEIMKGFISGMEDLRGVFVSDPVMTQAVGQAVAEKTTKDKIHVIGFGSDEKLVKLLQDDVITGLIVEDPFRMGYDGVKTAFAASKGEKVPANIEIEATLITKANLSSARAQELLKPNVK